MPIEIQRRDAVIPNRPANVDVAQRILYGVRFMTRQVADDGLVIVPDGMRTDVWERDPRVLARHGNACSMDPANIGRGIAIRSTVADKEADVQFADTELGRDYAYLYGVNADRQVYARGWSFGWRDAEVQAWSVSKAREWMGDEWDEDLVPAQVLRELQVPVITRSVLTEISVTPNPSDLNALTRAARDHGIREAGRLAQAMRLDQAETMLDALRTERELDRGRIARLERELAALRGEAPSPAALGYGEGIVQALEALRTEVRR